jgi:hypothetical protein
MDLNSTKLLLNTIIEQYNGDKLDIKKYVDELIIMNKYEYINKDILSTDKKNYILKHPAKSNKRCCEYRLSHTSNPITKIVKINYNDLKYIINNWKPDDEIGRNMFITDINNDIKKRCLFSTDILDNYEIIQVFINETPDKIKYVIFNKNEQMFYLRTSFTKEWLNNNDYKECKESQDKEWLIDTSTLLASKLFWVNLKNIINNI